jgi:hypothetical protein
LIGLINWVHNLGSESSQIYNDEIGVLIGKAKKTPDEALAACRRVRNRTSQNVQREVLKHIKQ